MAVGGIELRFALAADFDRLSAFSTATYIAAFGPGFRPDDLVAHLDAKLSPSRWQEYLARDRVLMAASGDVLVGYLQFGPAGMGDGIEIRRLYVAPDRQGEGIGTWLLQAAFDHPEIASATAVSIDVWSEDAGARRLYERFGFVATGAQRPFVTASGEVTGSDMVMLKKPDIKGRSTPRS